MSFKNLILFALVSIIGTTTIAQQQGVCGMLPEHHETLIERLKANVEQTERESYERSMITRILPVVFHIINKSDGTGGIPVTRVFDQICNLNEFYEDQVVELQFMIQEINYINNNAAFTDHFSSNGIFIFNQNKRSGAINIYVPEDADSGNPLGGTVLGYYDPNRDWIVMRPSEVTAFSNTLHHEMGHYLSLEHPFYGWDFEAYDPGVHGVQVGNTSPGGNQNERMDGSNCTIAGDMICDTPPDYNHFDTNWGCNYNGGAQDPNGTLIDPDETNIMSYFNSCNPKAFTTKQKEVLNADITTRINQGNLQLPSQTHPGNVAAMGSLIEPINNEVIPNNANIFFDWPDVANADNYYLEIDRVPTFSLTPSRFELTTSEYFFDGSALLVNTNYYWRVRAYNNYDYCSGWSSNGQFKSSVINSVNTLDQVTSAQVMPNPANVGDEIILSVDSQAPFIGSLQIYNVGGQLMNSIAQRDFRKGINKVTLGTQQLAAGLYFVQLRSDDGVFQSKLIVQ